VIHIASLFWLNWAAWRCFAAFARSHSWATPIDEIQNVVHLPLIPTDYLVVDGLPGNHIYHIDDERR